MTGTPKLVSSKKSPLTCNTRIALHDLDSEKSPLPDSNPSKILVKPVTTIQTNVVRRARAETEVLLSADKNDDAKSEEGDIVPSSESASEELYLHTATGQNIQG